MGLTIRFCSAVFLLSSSSLLHATPMLRVVTSTVGPVQVSTGGSAATQTVEAYNAGDGSLGLSVSASATWIAASVGAARACTTTLDAGTCIPLQFALSTSGLAAGTYTGVVTVTAPGAIDAPQTITVTVRVGSVDVFVAPGGTRDISISTSKPVTVRTSTNDGGQWLSLVLDGTGSFRFAYPYRIHLEPPAGMATGTYNGTVNTSGSPVSAENMTIPVTMRVTTQPIADASPNPVNVRLAQGAAPLVYPFSPAITVSNLGQGSLAVQAVTASGGSWLKTNAFPFLSLDPTGLSPGSNAGTVTIPSNAINGTLTVPVNLEIVAKDVPLIYYQGVLDNGTYVPGDTVAPGDVMVLKGEQLSFSPYTPGSAPPLAATVGGASITVNGTTAPLFYSSYGQLAFQMPVNTAPGTALVQAQRDDGQKSNLVSVKVAGRAPRLLQIGVGTYGAIVNAKDGSIPMPVGSFPGVNTHPASAGDTLTIYAIGLGATNPVVATGAPAPSAEPLARVTSDVTVNFGGLFSGILATPAFAGLTPTAAGLYQVNVTIPSNVPTGIISVSLGFSDVSSNAVQIAIQ